MPKNALILKGADFSANKVTTITISTDEKPCTEITLDQSAITATELGDTTLTATVTPADTTDDVIWTTSDASVATVSNGVVSVVGLGTATITATCGAQSATCTVTCNEITLSPAYGFFKKANLTNYPNTYAYSTSNRELLIHALTGTKTLKNQTSDTTARYPIGLPQNTAKVTLSYGSDMRSGVIYFGWLNGEESAYPEKYPDVAGLVSLDTSNSSAYKQPRTLEYEKPEGATAFAIIVTPVSTDYADTDTPESIAHAKGIVVKCSVAS